MSHLELTRMSDVQQRVFASVGDTGVVDLEAVTNSFDDPRTRDKIEHLERVMKGMDGQLKLEPKHYHAKGLYARELFIPKGTVATGKVHIHEHLNFVTLGEVTVMTEDGPVRIKAPHVLVSKPGTKRAVYAHEDTIWTTVHATEETEVAALEASLVVDTYAQYEALALTGSRKEMLT